MKRKELPLWDIRLECLCDTISCCLFLEVHCVLTMLCANKMATMIFFYPFVRTND